MADQIFTNEELAAAAGVSPEPNLPPPGQQRREELARRKDALEEQAEKKYADAGRIDPKVLEPDRELQSQIRNNYLEIDIGPAFMVKWVNYVSQNGSAVWQAKIDGWQVVTADMLVDKIDFGLVKEDNTLRVGDVLAMFIRKDQHLLLERKRAEKQLRQQYGAESELHEIVGKHSKALQIRDTTTDPNLMNRIKQRAAASQVAVNHLGNKLKQGTIPGVPIK